jgi:hypothetical protein
MQGSISPISDIGLMAVLFAMFVIVFVCIRKAVKEMSFFGDAAGWAVSFCVALLSIAGLVRFFGSPETATAPAGEPRETCGLIDFVLLPYVALVLTILLVLLLLGVGKVLHGREPQHHWKPARSVRTAVKPHLERGRKPGKETKAPESTDERPTGVMKNTMMKKRTETTRFDS